MTFCAVVTSHANEAGLRSMLGCLRYQTRKPDRTIVLCSDTPGLARMREDFPDVEFVETENRGDWGHAKRAHGLDLASGEWVGFFNDDDAYDETYLEKMLVAATDETDVVYCEWNENPGCGFAMFQSTAGNFIVRRELAQAVGWTGREYEADGQFIEGVKAAGARVVKVEERLYSHNAFEQVPA